MAPTETPVEMVFKNVLRNTSLGIFGEVLYVNVTSDASSEGDGEAADSSAPDDNNSTFSAAKDSVAACANGTAAQLANAAAAASGGHQLGEIPAKEVIIVLFMLALWIYSIVLTRKAWYRILKE